MGLALIFSIKPITNHIYLSLFSFIFFIKRTKLTFYLFSTNVIVNLFFIIQLGLFDSSIIIIDDC